MRKYLILFVLVGFTFATNLVANGDFEQPLTTGWLQSSSGSSITINRATTYDPDPDYEAYAYKGAGSGFAKLYQVIDVATTDLGFSINAKVYAYDNNADTSCWAAAAVIISYLDATGSILGDTRICMRTTPCPWVSTSTTHLITASDSLWHNYAFNIDDELANLPGVSPSDVKKIEIALYDTTDHTC